MKEAGYEWLYANYDGTKQPLRERCESKRKRLRQCYLRLVSRVDLKTMPKAHSTGLSLTYVLLTWWSFGTPDTEDSANFNEF